MSQESEWQEEAPEIGTGLIFGNVVDESGNPLEGVRITTNDSATYTGSKGEFLIGDRVCLNPHQLLAYREGFVVKTEKDLEIKAGARQQINLTLSMCDGVVSGVVKDSAGNPLGGVHVCLASPNKPCTDSSSSDGSYALPDQCGTWAITGTKATYQPYNSTAKIPGTKNFRMKK